MELKGSQLPSRLRRFTPRDLSLWPQKHNSVRLDWMLSELIPQAAIIGHNCPKSAFWCVSRINGGATLSAASQRCAERAFEAKAKNPSRSEPLVCPGGVTPILSHPLTHQGHKKTSTRLRANRGAPKCFRDRGALVLLPSRALSSQR
jgi:hypothetical protein